MPAKKATKKADVVKSEADLQKDLETLRKDFIETKRAHKAGELVNPRAITKARKEIARVLTKLNAPKKEAEVAPKAKDKEDK